MIKLTDTALKHFAKKLKETGAVSFVHLSTKKSGCSGLSYVTEIKTGTPSAETSLVENREHLPIYIDNQSKAYLDGMVLDYQSEGLQHQVVYLNPNETGRCGCGKSFTVK